MRLKLATLLLALAHASACTDTHTGDDMDASTRDGGREDAGSITQDASTTPDGSALDATTPVDAAIASDAATPFDAAAPLDASPADGAPEDGGATTDAAPPDGAVPSDAGAVPSDAGSLPDGAVCATDDHCHLANRCLEGACWYPCADDDECLAVDVSRPRCGTVDGERVCTDAL